MTDKSLWYQISDLAWSGLCSLLGCEQAPSKPDIIYDDNPGGYGWHMSTTEKLPHTPGISRAINKLRIAFPDHTQWLDYRPEPFRKHDNFYIGKFGATTYDTSEEPKRSRKLILSYETRIYLVQIALNLKVKPAGKRTSETSLCSAVLEAMGLGSIRPLLDEADTIGQRRSLSDMLKPIKLTPSKNKPPITAKAFYTPEEIARQALINVGVDPELLERYGILADAPIVKDNTPNI